METSTRRDTWLPALLVLASGLAALWVRPAIPLDETRYLEVAREMVQNGPWLLTLNGEPYAHKPPLLLWIGHLLGALGPGLELGLRAVPAIASALTVIVVARMGKALGAPLAGWLQAAFLAPFLYAHALYFDSLLAATVIVAVAAWSRDRRGLAWIAASAALLTKGPAALLSLAPFLWAADAGGPDRSGRARARRSGALCLLAALPLALWGLAAGRFGGPAFRHELWWSQTAERVVGASSHEEGPWFFLVVLAAGLLPATFVLFVRAERAPRDSFLARLPWALLVPVVGFSLFPGKQPHYVLPLFPAFALLLARRLELAPRAVGALRAGAFVVVLSVLGGLAWAWIQRHELLERYGEYGPELLATRSFTGFMAVAFTGAFAALAVVLHPRFGARAWVGASVLVIAGFVLPIEQALGAVVLPRRIAAELSAAPSAPLATYRAQQAGLYAWMSGRNRLEDVRDAKELALWVERHPGGLVAFEDKLWLHDTEARALAALGLVAVRHDLVRGSPSTLWRAPGTPSSAASAPAAAAP